MSSICSITAVDGVNRVAVKVRLPTDDDVLEAVVVGSTTEGFFCIEAACPHSGGPLSLGDIEDLGTGDPSIVCPWHAYRFSLKSGESPQCELHPAKVLQLDVRDGYIYFRDPEVHIQSVTHFKAIKKAKPSCVKPRAAADPATSQEALTLVDWAILILQTADPSEKVRLTNLAAALWNEGSISQVGSGTPPTEPSRQADLTTVAPSQTTKRGKGGTLASRVAILHSLANIEQWAIDLAWDIIARFATYVSPSGIPLPRDFFTDFVRVAYEEAKHYRLLVERLAELGSGFGCLPVHGGLWDSAMDTSHDLSCRLAIVHMVHEARGLDVNPQTIAKFARAGDTLSVEKLKVIHDDEITHVAAGQRWFSWIVSESPGVDRYALFHEIVRKYFRGDLKPPFNDEARLEAGLDVNYYMPLVKNKKPPRSI